VFLVRLVNGGGDPRLLDRRQDLVRRPTL
jgi:hypothetical protein